MKIIGLLLALTALMAAGQGNAQPQSSQAIRIVVGFQAGGGTDLVARLLATRLESATGQTVRVENQPGAFGRVAVDRMHQSRGDGQTLLLSNEFIFRTDRLDPASPAEYGPTSLTPVAQLARVPYVLVARSDLPQRTLTEFVSGARSARETLIGFPGNDTARLAANAFVVGSRLSLTAVPYRDLSSVLAETMLGRLDVSFLPLSDVLPRLSEGRLRPLAVTSGPRHPAMREVPSVREAFDAECAFTGFFGLFVAPDTQRVAVQRLSDSIAKAAGAPDFIQALTARGFLPEFRDLDDFSGIISSEIDRFRAINVNRIPQHCSTDACKDCKCSDCCPG
jgi:tripartite-type tricarboxylate transporter receptor subunit TctC